MAKKTVSAKGSALRTFGLRFGNEALAIKRAVLRRDPDADWRKSGRYLRLKDKIAKRREEIVKDEVIGDDEDALDETYLLVPLTDYYVAMSDGPLTMKLVWKTIYEFDDLGYEMHYHIDSPLVSRSKFTEADEWEMSINQLYGEFRNNMSLDSSRVAQVRFTYTRFWLPMNSGIDKPIKFIITLQHPYDDAR